MDDLYRAMVQDPSDIYGFNKKGVMSLLTHYPVVKVMAGFYRYFRIRISVIWMLFTYKEAIAYLSGAESEKHPSKKRKK